MSLNMVTHNVNVSFTSWCASSSRFTAGNWRENYKCSSGHKNYVLQSHSLSLNTMFFYSTLWIIVSFLRNWLVYCKNGIKETCFSCLMIRGETQKFPELLKKLFKAFVQVWNVSSRRSIPPATGCSNPSTAPNGNAVKGRQRFAGDPWQHFRWRF